MNVGPTNVVTRTTHQQRREVPNQQPGPDHNPENGGSHTITDGPHTVRPQSAMPSVRPAGTCGTAGTRVPRYSGNRRVLAVIIGVLTAVTVLSSCGISSGEVTSKGYEPPYTYQCQTGSIPVGNVHVPVYGVCVDPECWWLGLKNNEGNGAVCVDQQSWENSRVGEWYPRAQQ